MAIVGGLDLHRAQVAFDVVDMGAIERTATDARAHVSTGDTAGGCVVAVHVADGRRQPPWRHADG